MRGVRYKRANFPIKLSCLIKKAINLNKQCGKFIVAAAAAAAAAFKLLKLILNFDAIFFSLHSIPQKVASNNLFKQRLYLFGPVKSPLNARGPEYS